MKAIASVMLAGFFLMAAACSNSEEQALSSFNGVWSEDGGVRGMLINLSAKEPYVIIGMVPHILEGKHALLATVAISLNPDQETIVLSLQTSDDGEKVVDVSGNGINFILTKVYPDDQKGVVLAGGGTLQGNNYFFVSDVPDSAP